MSFKNDFPILNQKVNGLPLIYFDNAATSQKPNCVLETLDNYYSNYNSNVHRGVHELSQQATNAYEASRETVSEFIGSRKSNQIVFTKGTTDGINLVARSWAAENLKRGDEILISTMEHHSNIVPWQMVCDQIGAKLIVAPIDQKGQLIMDEMIKMISSKTKLISISHVSNTLGTINPISEIIDIGHKNNCKVLIDAAQSIPHFSVNVEELNCDFLVFSGHKIFGPTGVGVLYVKEEIYKEMKPFMGGGDMIKEVTFDKTTYNEPPFMFEAGTPNIAGVIALAKAISYVQQIGMSNINNLENELLTYATEELCKIDKLNIVGTATQKASVISFNFEGIHPFDIGTLLDQMGIAIRTGHHCTQPLMDFYKIPGTARASFAFYNTKEEIEIFIKSLKKVIKMLT
ncbi:MAG: aminotransferase class V-fold PLP-dependent enzyme [Parvicellaceae bacterium]